MLEHEGKKGRKESGSEEKEGRRIGNKSVRRRREGKEKERKKVG